MFNTILYWLAWIILPVIIETIPTFYNFIFLIKKKINKKPTKKLDFFPDITIMIPVYNSSKTLENCIASINNSSYKNSSIEVILIDNGSKDNSFKIFQDCQIKFPTLAMNWMSSKQGKSKALNKAIFNSHGKYIINIDSDGILEKDALNNLIYKFENDKDVDCMTGTILIEPSLIEDTKGFFLRIFRRLEFIEYCQAFLASRNYQSEKNSIFTLSGAFSAFRKSTLLKTQLYNTSTICEDTHLTFQVKTNLKQEVKLCEDALFFVDPIDDFNKFYTQRQRWQIGELEVNHMFYDKIFSKNPLKILFNKDARLLIIDHTFSFPKMVWYFALMALCALNYSFDRVIFFTLIVYFLYVINGFLYFLNVNSFLSEFPHIKKYYKSKVFYLFLLPIYTLISFFIRLAGIVNSIHRKASWRTNTITDERYMVEDAIRDDFSVYLNFRNKVRQFMEK